MIPVLTAVTVNYFEEIGTMMLSILGFGIIAVVFYVGGLFTNALKDTFTSITKGVHLHLDGTTVHIILKGLIAAVMLILSASAMPSFHAVVDTMMPFGDFYEISAEFASQKGRFLINIVFNVVLEQIALSIAYFIPFILVDMVVSFLEYLLCDRDGMNLLQVLLLYLVDIVTLYAVNAFVLQSGTYFGVIMLNFLRTIKLSLGFVRFLALIALFVVTFFFAMQDILHSDILIAILGVNITAALMNVAVTDSNRFNFLAIAIVCGFLSKTIKRFFENEDNFQFDAVYALIALVATGLISALIFTLAR